HWVTQWMSLTISTCGSSRKASQSHTAGFSTAPSTVSFQRSSGTCGWMPRSSTGHSRTRRWPGGSRSLFGRPVRSLPCFAHCCLVPSSFSLSLPNIVAPFSSPIGTLRSLARSAAVAQQPPLLPLPVALLRRGALVVELLAARQRHLDLRQPALVEVDRE